MKLKIITSALILISFLFFNQSCKKANGGETKISKNGDDESHNKGENCMECHKSGGKGEGIFNIAGTVYNEALSSELPNTTIKIYSGPNGTGTLKYTIEGDALGNFYTTEDIDFSGDLYPAVEGNTTTKYMASSISNGKCNSCHGVSTDKIWTK